ncbi:hypothetical protein KP509_01G029000 [Ceratopteris richardii]|uniref:Uncharacterized protein n=1 Tax=Ceratopteris richardii TaxID=49495 RepID=A0A8T2VBT5_CERRI|nr:hypothetical protein KP509_01G029000 [Ceratopteris richardii]
MPQRLLLGTEGRVGMKIILTIISAYFAHVKAPPTSLTVVICMYIYFSC